MYLLGFDSGTKNIGVCCIYIRQNLLTEVNKRLKLITIALKAAVNSMIKYMEQLPPNESPISLLGCIVDTAIMIRKMLDSTLYYMVEGFNIIHVSMIDLIGDNNVKVRSVSEVIRTSRLKQELNLLDEKLKSLHVPWKDMTVLIEYQMGPNDLARSVASQITYHYSNVVPIHIVGPSLKNKYYLHPDGKHSKFIVSYSNVMANKKQTQWNLNYYIALIEDCFSPSDHQSGSELSRNDHKDNKDNKDHKDNQMVSMTDIKKYKSLRDIADAFMMCYAWYREQFTC